MRLLVIETDAALQRLVRHSITREGAEAVICSTAAEAKAALAAGGIDAMMAEYRLDRETVVPLLEEMRARNQKIPVRVITASPRECAEALRRASVDVPIVDKPVAVGAVARELMELVRTSASNPGGPDSPK